MTATRLREDRQRPWRALVAPGLTLLISVLAVPGFLAADAPHWYSSPASGWEIGCSGGQGQGCHNLHNSPGGTLGNSETDIALCLSCHSEAYSGLMPQHMQFSTRDNAVAGTSGTSHTIRTVLDADPANNPFQTNVPTDQQMSLRMPGGQIVCTTCHNPHSVYKPALGEESTQEPRVGDVTTTSAAGSLTVDGSGFGFTEGYWFLLEIVTAGGVGTATYKVSIDNEKTWDDNAGAGYATGADVPLGDAASGLQLAFSGSFVTGETFEFYASWLFLRAPASGGVGEDWMNFCAQCHQSWVQQALNPPPADPTPAESPWATGEEHSHVAQIMTEQAGKVRAVPLDCNGAPQVAGSPTEMRLWTTNGKVTCLTCHGMHNAKSSCE